jgi:hypothetical protein
VDGGKTWRPIMAGLQALWPGHMVDRFVQVEDELLAVLSNGQLLAASLATLAWRPLLPTAQGANAVTYLSQ